MNTRFAIVALTASALALGACKKEPPESLPPQPLPTNASNTPVTDPNAGMSGPGTQTHFEQMVNGQNVIFFDTDRYNIDSADAAALQTQARYLAQYPNVTVTVEGHADERGTRDYNLALGERRANSAKNYLVSLGVPATRVRTVSYGKERPVALGSNEQAWAQNRRAVTVVVN
ncbi:peptidoglycan-associated lipoprotein Pal [Altererythrobacter sp. SALINAS58]|uniref:peptidoglycan-associated lipoprotein Pal n=1 Tax=Alteripontixanthobacter muriae TaxID=2705546 RepID=UPI0015762D95|nr:peptidoglycan-associated lipoprotein Pal [Alteripontixanthobacter muriae]NTZ42575.1 peptidoglycan-associated lipoprotein Pal [Alteripontixanthobacter muriae]